MKLQILHVPDCPNVARLQARLNEVLVGPHAVEVSRRELRTLAEAAAAGMTGSPTLLVDGTDPFRMPDQQPSLSCRLYRDPSGRVDGSPSQADLQKVLGLRDG
ncbi:MAG: alkylmercury lyase [Actinomycetota bacterium]|nr:alkylmercury lyase [Actinomycetota bacterium]